IEGDLYKLRASGSKGHTWATEEDVLYSLTGTASLYGGAYTDLESFYYLGNGVGGQADLHRSVSRNPHRLTTLGSLYALTYEMEGPYKNYRKDISQSDDDSYHSNIDTSGNGLSSSMQFYAEWLKINDETLGFFIRPFVGANLPGTPIPFMTDSDNRFLSIYSTGLYWGIRKDNNCLYLKWEIDALSAFNISMGTTF
ncbi:MAG: hypothetical protein PF447_07305, partial [Spirochaetaceae bacterium]|nr:hypothetical protein [Spirochaetaceae bacterium]